MKKLVSIFLILSMMLSFTVSLVGCDFEEKGEQDTPGETSKQEQQETPGETSKQEQQETPGKTSEREEQDTQGETSKQEQQDTQVETSKQEEQNTPDKIDEHTHTYTAWTTTKAETCEEDGVQLHFCVECNYVEARSIAHTGHKEEKIPGYAKTCIKDGLTDGLRCITCGKITKKQETIKTTGHTLIHERHEEKAKCTQYGYVANEKCSKCGYRPKVSKTAPLGHDLDENGTCKTCNTGVPDFLWDLMYDHSAGFMGLSSIGYASYRDEDFKIFKDYTDVILPTMGWGNLKILPWLDANIFDGCYWLEALTIPEHFISIDYKFATGCDALRYVYIPSTVTFIGEKVFSGCFSLETIHYGGTIAQWNAITKDASWDSGCANYTVFCTDGEITK